MLLNFFPSLPECMIDECRLLNYNGLKIPVMGVEFCKQAFSPHYITFDRDGDDTDHKRLQSVTSLFS